MKKIVKEKFFESLKFDEKGLISCITQCYKTGDILMFAFMNEESLRKTLDEGFACYWSRSRNSLWTKGETSGHTQKVKEIFLDCDGDAILLKVEQIGPACHTGEATCFFTKLDLNLDVNNA